MDKALGTAGMDEPLQNKGKEADGASPGSPGSPDFAMIEKTTASFSSPERPPSLDVRDHQSESSDSGADAAAGISLHDSHGASNSGLRRVVSQISKRGFSTMTVGGIRHSMITLTSTALGGGMLAVSYVMFMCGLGLGIILLVFGAILAYISTIALMEISQETGRHTYAGLFSHCAGPLAGPILDVMLFVYGNGSCVGYLVFLGDFIPDVAKLIAPDAAEIWHSRSLAIVASACVVAPLSMVRDVSALRFMAPVSILTLTYVAGVIAARTPSDYTQNHGQPGYGEMKIFDFNSHIFEAFAICVFAFNCHLNVVPVAGALVRPTKARIVKVSYRVNALQLCFYLLIACTGYSSFLGRTAQDILNCYDTHDPFMAVARFLLTLTMMVAIPINMVPTIRSGLQFWRFFVPGPTLMPPSPTGSPRLGSPMSSPMSERSLSPAEEGSALPRVITAAICMAAQAFLAIQIPGVADVLGLMGASVATAMMLMIPAYCIRKVMPRTTRNLAKQVLLWFFALISFASIPIKILRAANILKN